jgi:hypothetical protein
MEAQFEKRGRRSSASKKCETNRISDKHSLSIDLPNNDRPKGKRRDCPPRTHGNVMQSEPKTDVLNDIFGTTLPEPPFPSIPRAAAAKALSHWYCC